jgi:hypothetical protein
MGASVVQPVHLPRDGGDPDRFARPVVKDLDPRLRGEGGRGCGEDGGGLLGSPLNRPHQIPHGLLTGIKAGLTYGRKPKLLMKSVLRQVRRIGIDFTNDAVVPSLRCGLKQSRIELAR